jgi:protease-4
VTQARQLPPGRIDELIERSLFVPEAARAARLVDSVASAEQVESQLETLMGGAVTLGLPSPPSRPRSWAPPGIAVVHVEGDISEGKSRAVPFLDLKTVGGETLTQALAEVERDSQVRAVVIRVDSPGGSALWADLLARQVSQLRKVKPVVCSFGDLAASGGYYLAAMCGEIFTNPSTITGSIGIYGGKVDVSGLLSLLSAKRVSIQHGSHADMDGPYRPYSDAERQLVTERLQQGYDRFVNTVAAGRRLSYGEVDAMARGRVWTGSQAVSRKLCDKTGGLGDAIAAARARAGMPSRESEDELRFFPRAQPGVLDRLLDLAPDLLTSGAAVGESLPGLAPLLNGLVGLVSPLGAALLLTREAVLTRLDGDLGDLTR